MHKLYTLFLFLLMLPLQAFAEKWTPENLPMVHLQDARRYVCNPDGVLKSSTVFQADSILAKLEKDKGVQTVAIVVNQLQGDNPYQFGMALGRKYGIGSQKQRTGLIVILAVEDRSYQILTGNGLEGALPDAICRRIQNKVMLPELRKQNWDNALIYTLRSIDGYIRNDHSIISETSSANKNDNAATIGIIIALCFGAIFIAIVIIESKKRRCPSCHNAQMHLVSQQRVRLQGSGQWVIRTIMRCPRCGHEKIYYRDDDNSNSDNPIPPIFMGGFGNHSSGSFSGGFSGGSFGGGSFGGGGSGGRF